MLPELGVLADDLTGALDSAAPFATRCSETAGHISVQVGIPFTDLD